MSTTEGYMIGRFKVPTGGAAVAATTTGGGGGGPTTVTVPAANYYIDGPAIITASLVAAFQTALNAARAPANWTVTWSQTTGKVTIHNSGAATWSITWTSTLLRDMLGFAANIVAVSAPQTGTIQVPGTWFSDCPVLADMNHLATPRVTDLRQTRNPSGLVISHRGNVMYRHRNIRWTNIANSRMWVVAETGGFASLETFLIHAQWGLGHTWFRPGAMVHILAGDGNFFGNERADGWYLGGLAASDDLAKRAAEAFDGFWTVTIPEATTDSVV